MSDVSIADILNVEGRFLRSANLERDFRDPTALSGYVVTDFARSSLERIAEGLKPASGHRAWRVTGHYGAGKSSFALFLAHLIAGRESTLPPQLRRVTELGQRAPRFLPVLVTCARQPLSLLILRALHQAAATAYGRGSKSKLVSEINRVAASKSEPKDEEVLDLILRFNTQLIAESKAKGLMLILDELGKTLEFAALHPGRQDVYLLQRLAETASRSGDEPLFIISLLHQGFSAYVDHLDQSSADGCGASTCAEVWTAATGGSIGGAPAVGNGVVYTGSSFENAIYAFDVDTGALLWSFSGGSTQYGGDTDPSVADGMLFATLTWSFRVYAFRLP